MTPRYDVVVVGSGFAGLCMGVKLRQAGITNFIILEKDQEFGGTWWANAYPGCAVDIPSHLYSFSFAQNAGWTRRFALRDELLAYTRSVARDFGLEAHIRVDTALESASFDEEGGYWHVRTSQGALTAKCVVGALGALNRPAIPDLPGLASFTGPMFHSARWDHDVDLRGKRVAVIGTGASAVQFIPEIVGKVARLDVYQRSAPWVLPRPDRAISRPEQWLLARSKALQWLYRALVYVHYESRALWYVYLPRVLRIAQWEAQRHMRKQVADPVLRRKLTPDYALGCKRALLINDYYPALQQPHVALVTERIAEVRGNTIVSASGEEREVDAIVFGTGFQVEQAMHAAQVRGRGGKLMFADSLEAYKGCTVTGFPNYFFIIGPNAGLGHNSIIYMIESAVAYAVGAIKAIRDRQLHSVDVKAGVQDAYNAAIQKRLKGTVWSLGCRSWYLDATGRNYTIWPGFTFAYRRITRRFDIENYEVS
ncbi:MAG: NAD(P)/FAD-dependent oxidoreductase [Pseudomonadota bacterium]